jgi:hypothetical protein
MRRANGPANISSNIAEAYHRLDRVLGGLTGLPRCFPSPVPRALAS